jgi:hypothetical protein
LKKRTVAFIVLLTLLANAYCVTSATLTVTPDEPLSLFELVSCLGKPTVAFADPVPGGPGSGGD